LKKLKTERDELMTHLNFTLDEAIVKELLLGNREEAMSKLLEEIFNAILSAQATEQIKAEPYERSEDRITSRNGYRDRGLQGRVVDTESTQIPGGQFYDRVVFSLSA